MFITLLPIHKNKSRSISQIVRQELLLRKQLFHALHKCIFKLKIGGTHNFLGLLRIGNNYQFSHSFKNVLMIIEARITKVSKILIF